MRPVTIVSPVPQPDVLASRASVAMPPPFGKGISPGCKLVRAACVLGVLQGVAAAQTVWTQVATTGPSARYGHSMAFDSARGRSVLFGGFVTGGILVGDTWEWDGASWIQVATTGPSARSYHAMAYDSLRGRTVLFGGNDGGVPGDTWEWDGIAWTQVATTGPSGRYFPSMVYDSLRGRTVLFGGYNGFPFGDTWEWDGTTWTQVAATGPSARFNQSMAYDSLRGHTMLFGGNTLNELSDTWTWDGIIWTQVATIGPARTYHSMAYDNLHGRTLLFGGESGASLPADTWAWDGIGWTQVAATGPSGRYLHSIVYDSLRGLIVLFGGTPGSGGSYLGDTWETEPTVIATAQVYGTACGSPAITLVPHTGSRPILGHTQISDINHAFFGFAAVIWGVTGQALPLDFMGIDGCTLWSGAEGEIGSFCPSTSFTTAQHSFSIPFDATLIGVHVYLQAWTAAPGFNTMGIATSNGVELVIGEL
ncbi:MAG: hypothetical protein JNK78_19805 [Planctomycetes bacterium]|nr:hypothetical protein [Planctomycetota bacterium]